MAKTLRSFDARFRAAEGRLRAVVARGDVADDPTAYYRGTAEADTALADLYREARKVVRNCDGITWMALFQAERTHRVNARRALDRLTERQAV